MGNTFLNNEYINLKAFIFYNTLIILINNVFTFSVS